MNNIIIIKEVNNHKITKTGKLEQKFIVKNNANETLAIFKHYSPKDSEIYPAGEYFIDNFDIDVRPNGDFCNFFMRNLTFKKKGK